MAYVSGSSKNPLLNMSKHELVRIATSQRNQIVRLKRELAVERARKIQVARRVDDLPDRCQNPACGVLLAEVAHGARGLCKRCYSYMLRHRVLPDRVYRVNRNTSDQCANPSCGVTFSSGVPCKAKGRCGSCYEALRRNGRDRSVVKRNTK